MNKEYLDEENININILNGIKTDPKKTTRSFLTQKTTARTPLASIQTNFHNLNNENVVITRKIADKKVQSEPIISSKSRSRILEKSTLIHVSDHQIQPKNMTDKLSGKHFKVSNTISDKNKNTTKLTSSHLAKLLDYDTYIEDELRPEEKDPVKLFCFLEKEGRLSPEILKVFSKLNDIKSINMTKSYAGILEESGLLKIAKFSPVLCTKAFYSGFTQLLSIDFTNVSIHDDEIRYLIKLKKLQALGLSGTLITDKSIKYLSTYATFKENLKCLKLCYISGISDNSMKYLNSFIKLSNLDLRGNDQITLKGCIELNFESEFRDLTKFRLEIPKKIEVQLSEKHLFYLELCKNYTNLILDPKDTRIDQQTLHELKNQLKQHKQFFSDVYLTGDTNTLRSRLVNILRIRKKEEILYSYCYN